MNEPYENMLLGMFIFLLGRKSKDYKNITNATINLYQQTKLDTTFGDLFLATTKKNIILEFKRSLKECQAELKKKNRQRLLEVLNCNEHIKEEKKHSSTYLEISRKCHFIVYPRDTDAHLYYFPYVELSQQEFNANRIEQLMDSFYTENSDLSDSEEFKYYIQLLININNGNWPLGGGGGNQSSSKDNICGIVLSLNEENEIKTYSFYSYEQLEAFNKLIAKETTSSINKSNSGMDSPDYVLA